MLNPEFKEKCTAETITRLKVLKDKKLILFEPSLRPICTSDDYEPSTVNYYMDPDEYAGNEANGNEGDGNEKDK